MMYSEFHNLESTVELCYLGKQLKNIKIEKLLQIMFFHSYVLECFT
jgi:hypothetical protein